MKQIIKESHLLWGGLVLVFLVFLGVDRPVNSESDRTRARVDKAATFRLVYTGPSGNYAATPHPGTLVYSMAKSGEELSKSGER